MGLKLNDTSTFKILVMLCISFVACQDDDVPTPVVDPMEIIETELDIFVSSLISNTPDSANLASRIADYLNAQPNSFFGSTVTLLDTSGKATYSPYLYRSGDSLGYLNLADTSYHIDNQDWLRQPIDDQKAVWTEPYFDAGGGEIWMRTRSVPVLIDRKIIAVATTDLEVEKP